jgi:hypothetical protein
MKRNGGLYGMEEKMKRKMTCARNQSEDLSRIAADLAG